MITRIRLVTLCLILAGLCGCELTDYQPHHETPITDRDLRKDGTGTYGGTNSTFATGLPGTPAATGPATQSVRRTPQDDAGSGPAFNTSAQGSFTQTGSYSGSNTGGGTGSDVAPSPTIGTTNTGAASGR